MMLDFRSMLLHIIIFRQFMVVVAKDYTFIIVFLASCWNNWNLYTFKTSTVAELSLELNFTKKLLDLILVIIIFKPSACYALGF